MSERALPAGEPAIVSTYVGGEAGDGRRRPSCMYKSLCRTLDRRVGERADRAVSSVPRTGCTQPAATIECGTRPIHRLGTLAGRRVVFGYDRHVLPELDAYVRILAALGGDVVAAADVERPHYLTSAEIACLAIQRDLDMYGVLCCGTGIGMSIAANKFNGIYAARCASIEDAALARTINNANVICIAAERGLALNAQIVHAFASTPFAGRKLDELEYITSFEASGP